MKKGKRNVNLSKITFSTFRKSFIAMRTHRLRMYMYIHVHSCTFLNTYKLATLTSIIFAESCLCIISDAKETDKKITHYKLYYIASFSSFDPSTNCVRGVFIG